MTNKENFVKAFGAESYNKLMENIKAGKVVDILEWFLEDSNKDATEVPKPTGYPFYKAQIKKPEKPSVPQITEKFEEKKEEKEKRKYVRTAPSFDLHWYMTAIEDFYLSNKKEIEFAIDDDKSPNTKVKTICGLKYRFETAAKRMKLTKDDISFHVLDCNSCRPTLAIRKPAYYVDKFTVK